ncbi:sporulation killing factor system radical SAM maturase [Micromonospora sp. NPDC048947]|uniref:sporulation killing factor system radical SAM maturase n=1 Tax=Micromonospora sp. NPDC048947 TaxID=3154826 RepID=UPI00340383C9
MTTALSHASGDSVAGTADPPPPDWGVHLQPVGGLLVDRNSLNYVRLSSEALEIALQLARTRSVVRTARIRAGTSRRDPDEVQAEMVEALSGSWLTSSWLNGALDQPLRVSGSTDAYLPLLASLQLTNRCNLSCSFCYASSGAALPGELTADDWVKVLERLAQSGIAAVTLTGGEPTIARDFRRILATASALVDHVDIFTNGLHWSDELVAMAAACGNIRAQISIDGRAERHDLIRGRAGAYNESLHTMRRLTAAGIPVIVAMTVTPANYRDVAAVVSDVDSAGARLFRAGRVVPVGRGDQDGFGLTPDQVADVIRQFQETRHLNLEALGWDQCVDLGEQLAPIGLPVEFLTPGYLSWHVRADGQVTPCQIEAESLGRILTEPLELIGEPGRLAAVRSTARGCRCIQRLNPSEDVDLPFGLTPGPSIRGDATTSGCCGTARCGSGCGHD